MPWRLRALAGGVRRSGQIAAPSGEIFLSEELNLNESPYANGPGIAEYAILWRSDGKK